MIIRHKTHATSSRRRLSTVRAASSIVVALTMLPLLNAGTASAASLAESEPNSTIAAANALPADGSVLTGRSSSTGTVDNDYYRFDLAADGRLTINFTFSDKLGTAKVYDIDVLDSSGNKLYGFDLAGTNFNGAWLGGEPIYLPAGRGYLRVYADNSRTSWGQSYSLSITNTPGSVETENNGTVASADSLAIGTTVTGSSLISGTIDDDFYAIDLAADGLLKIQFTFPDNLGTGRVYDVEILDSSGVKLQGFGLYGRNWNGAWLASVPTYLAAGRWYLRVFSTNSQASWAKTYSLGLTSTPGLVETENNGSTATADQLPVGSTIAGTSLLAGGQDEDYYTFTLGTPQRIALGFTFPGGLGAGSAYDLALYNAAGTAVWSTSLTGADYTGAGLASRRFQLSAGRYYLRIYAANSRESWAKTYNLRVDLALVAATPKISGKAKVGKKLKVKVAAWAPKPVKLSYQWYRSGVAINGAKKTSYKLVKADKRKKITVVVTGSKPGYLSASVTSKSTKKVG